MTVFPAFSLQVTDSKEVVDFENQPAFICFVKEDCPTCNEVVPVLEALGRALEAGQGDLQLHVIGQTADGNRKLITQHEMSQPILDDSELLTSFAYDIETVPTLVATTDGTRLEGFVREEWQALLDSVDGLAVDWDQLPAWRPGCGSLSVDPAHADRLRALAEGSVIGARKIEVGQADDVFEFMFDQGFSDGLPLVPPTPERVQRMLDGTSRVAEEVIAKVPPNMGDATVEKIAINAVMAGCKPAYLPVVLAAVEAICTDRYNIHGVMATTMGASPVLVVNGPIRHEIGMNMQLGALGQGNRANATIGRAVRLVVRNVGGAHPGGTERSTLGNTNKFTMCFAEWEERNPWQPLHVERGYASDESVVTVYTASSGPMLIVDQDSRTASQLAGSFGLSLESIFHPKAHMASDTLVVVCPEHVDTFVRDGYTKAEIRQRIQEVTARPIRDLLADESSAVGFKASWAADKNAEQLDKPLPKFRSEDDIHLVVAGADAGKFSGAFHGWAIGEIGSQVVSNAIDPFR